jgi:hypothetical protein
MKQRPLSTKKFLEDPRINEILDKLNLILGVMQEAGSGNGSDGENPFEMLTSVIETLQASMELNQAAMVKLLQTQTQQINAQTKAIRNLSEVQKDMMAKYEEIQNTLRR